ncbi:amidohydrolase [Parapedobacter sp. SGR-10]|uniref:amidohydrolase n=1 Tax=Parapedobacter sp. SGR-10 TaxID=2710879 RepID=UPI0013D5358A|nr:amidohydrolase [Parapedobacter sp. SGR-10]NGF58041.1 amidohydrolase [Parapedobacter sp. SGR-10]
MKKRNRWLLLGALISVLFGFSPQTTVPADVVYINGNILTVNANNERAEAMAILKGRILAVGTNQSIRKHQGKRTKIVDLKGKTLIPGFIDGHSHFGTLTRFNTVDISPPPVGQVLEISDIVRVIKQYKDSLHIPAGTWIFARGYDTDQLKEKRHPVKGDLDAAFPDNPVWLTHNSGHIAVVNSYALKLSGINKDTPDPKGGQVVRDPKTGEATGLLLETARNLVKTRRKALTLEERLDLLQKQQEWYASHGITTAQNGSTSLATLNLLKEAAKRKLLDIDVEVLAARSLMFRLIDEGMKFGKLDKRLTLTGVKVFTDGSPQGKTAFFTEPYLTEVPGCDSGCIGMPTITQGLLDKSVLEAFKNNIQVYAHCNGDASIDMYIEAVKKANKALGKGSQERRPVIIHSQFVRPDQLDACAELGLIPSFFTNHAYFWGDVHTENLGVKRAHFLSPLRAAKEKGVIFTNHTDFGVTPINQLFLLWTSVARESRSGQIIGADQRVSPEEGLRAITWNGAYQYSEENVKGSLEPGKLADMVVLSGDPTKVPVHKIKDIVVLETIKEGKTIFKRN